MQRLKKCSNSLSKSWQSNWICSSLHNLCQTCDCSQRKITRRTSWRQVCYKRAMAHTSSATRHNWTKVRSRSMVSKISRQWLSSLNSKKSFMILSMFNKTIRCPRACSSCRPQRACSPILCQFVWSNSAVKKSSKRTIKSLSRFYLISTFWTVSGSTFCFYQTCRSRPLTSTTVWLTRASNLRKKFIRHFFEP